MKKIIFCALLMTFLFAYCKPTQKITNETSKAEKTDKKARKPILLDQQTFKITAISDDKTYGYEEKNPIKVGGSSENEGPLNERRFLNALAGPNGETITYRRRGSCCAFNTKNGLFGQGLLDIYEIQWEGLSKPVSLYINIYDADELKVPVGFTLKKN